MAKNDEQIVVSEFIPVNLLCNVVHIYHLESNLSICDLLWWNVMKFSWWLGITVGIKDISEANSHGHGYKWPSHQIQPAASFWFAASFAFLSGNDNNGDFKRTANQENMLVEALVLLGSDSTILEIWIQFPVLRIHLWLEQYLRPFQHGCMIKWSKFNQKQSLQ